VREGASVASPREWRNYLGINLSWLDLNYLGSQPWDLTQAELHVTVFDYSERGVRARCR
jgi:hypothetical protein